MKGKKFYGVLVPSNVIIWEIKSPIDNGKRTIQHQFSRTLRQSTNIILDARRSKMDMVRIYREVEKQAKITKSIKRLLQCYDGVSANLHCSIHLVSWANFCKARHGVLDSSLTMLRQVPSCGPPIVQFSLW